jgi:predicted DCC family thiol-disulfide oxidoreductase YuxK
MTELTRVRSPLLLYDGLCGFCDGTVQFILRRDPQGPLCFAPLQGETARAVLIGHPELLGVDSLILVIGVGEDQRVVVRSEAVLHIAKYLGGVWSLATILRVIPRPLRDGAYAFFARRRYQLFGRYDTCPVPAPEVRERFLP